jgi:hypothetical protein
LDSLQVLNHALSFHLRKQFERGHA